MIAKKHLNGWNEIQPQNLIDENGNPYFGYEFPEDLQKMIEEQKIFEYGGCTVCLFYKVIDGVRKYIVTTDNGGAYKCGAQFMTFEGNRGLCSWSIASLKRTLISMFNQTQIAPDPNYQS